MKRWVDSLRQSLGTERQLAPPSSVPAPPSAPPEPLDWPSIEELLDAGLLPEETAPNASGRQRHSA